MTDAQLHDAYRDAYRTAIASRASGSRAECPPVEAIEALVTQSGPEDTRIETLDHVMACDPCHRELGLLQAIRSAQPRQSSLMPRHWLAAAGLLVVLAGGALLTRTLATYRPPELMRGTPGGSESIAVVSPTSLPAGGVHALVWRSVPRATQYAVEVLDADGRVLYATRTSDTTAVVTRPLAAPAAWWVRATLADGTERNSQIIKLR